LGSLKGEKDARVFRHHASPTNSIITKIKEEARFKEEAR
jgi:hypothetical protein